MTTTKTLDLRGLSDAERDAKMDIAIAVIDGYTVKPFNAVGTAYMAIYRNGVKIGDTWDKPEDIAGQWKHHLPPYATSADAVLPLLTKAFIRFRYYNDDCRFSGDTIIKTHTACGDFALAACISLLRANGYEVLT